jgi:serine/threonine-protein kinase
VKIVAFGRTLLFSAALMVGLPLTARATLPPLPPGDPLAQDISATALDPQSATVISWLTGAGGFGTGKLRIDFSMEVNEAPAGTATLPVTQRPGYFLPDCDTGLNIPIPAGGTLEGEMGYQCISGGDCHLFVFDKSTNRLFESFNTDITNNVLQSACAVVWQLNAVYGPFRRGLQCVSTDSAGLPVAPLLFDADEVASGRIAHAIRFLLPNARIRANDFTLPATHGAGSTGPTTAPSWGARFRLRPDFPMTSLPNDAARTVATALQKYGMVLADGGNIALTARSDRFTTAKWAALLQSTDLQAIQVSDFQMIQTGTHFAETGNCVRQPAPQPPPSVPLPKGAALVLAAALAAVGAATLARRRARR